MLFPIFILVISKVFADDVSYEDQPEIQLFNQGRNFSATTTCGLSHVLKDKDKGFEGEHIIADFPWLGVLYYSSDSDRSRFITAVVLVTKQFVITSANDIEKLPKDDFRAKAKVIIGKVCTEKGVPIKEYTYHPEFDTYKSSIALIQLETGSYMHSLKPACPPPQALSSTHFYAIVIVKGCAHGYVTFYKVEYEEREACQQSLRTSENSGLWPDSATCTRTKLKTNNKDEGQCSWISGVPLMGVVGGRWRLFGFGTLGTGCDTPSLFLDYGQYFKWVRRSGDDIGMPAITHIGRNCLIMRKVAANIKRFGMCDKEEIKYEIFTDKVHLSMDPVYKLRSVTYNISLYQNQEYTCIIFKVYHTKEQPSSKEKPYLILRRFSSKDTLEMCHSYKLLEIDFEVTIFFFGEAYFELYVYGKKGFVFDPLKEMKKYNENIPGPIIPSYEKIRNIIKGKWH